MLGIIFSAKVNRGWGQYHEVSIVALIVGINRFSAENLKVALRTDRRTDELIWGGLGKVPTSGKNITYDVGVLPRISQVQ